MGNNISLMILNFCRQRCLKCGHKRIEHEVEEDTDNEEIYLKCNSEECYCARFEE